MIQIHPDRPARWVPALFGPMMIGWALSALAQGTLIIEPDDSSVTAPPSQHPVPAPESSAPDGWSLAPSELWLEFGAHDGSSRAQGTHHLHTTTGIDWRQGERWEARFTGRLDGDVQTGDPDVEQIALDYGESYLRYRDPALRLTLGPQVILWGRLDELAPTDRMSVVDLSRFMLDDLEDRRRAVPALRLEHFIGGFKTDLVWIPRFRAAELPDSDSIWHPIDRREGRILGLPTTPAMSALIEHATLDDGTEETDGQFGLRLSRSLTRLDYAVTVQRARQSTPYYQLNPTVRAALLSGMDPVSATASTESATFQAQYPKSWLFGGDLGFAAGGVTWRFEGAYLSDLPVTTTDLRYVTQEGIDWGVGGEFFPGDGDTRVTLQVLGHQILNPESILDWERTYALTGEVEFSFDRDRWRAGLRFWADLNQTSLYLNPTVTFVGWDPHEFYLSAHAFSGEDGTAGGFYQDDSLITLGWRAQFR